jgi:LAS superfamily LD-carboxypeptidase LdcB
MLSDDFLLGCDEQPMVNHQGAMIHEALLEPVCALQADAARAGFALKIVSGFRSFDRQLAIWNGKSSGQRPLLDEQGKLLDYSQLDEGEILAAILRWSALPGASRHHWGSDIDVYDAAAVPASYQVQLTPEEVAPEGVFGPMHEWLDHQLASGASYGFFRPYDEDRGGVAPERWHLSYAPLSARCESARNIALLRKRLQNTPLLLKDRVLAELENIFTRYIALPSNAYPSAYAALLGGSHDLVS